MQIQDKYKRVKDLWEKEIKIFVLTAHMKPFNILVTCFI